MTNQRNILRLISQDFKIDFEKKEITYNPAGSGTIYTVNELYSYLQDTFDEPMQMDDDIPMKAKSKTKYVLINGWSIDNEGLRHLKGGTLQLEDITTIIELSHHK